TLRNRTCYLSWQTKSNQLGRGYWDDTVPVAWLNPPMFDHIRIRIRIRIRIHIHIHIHIHVYFQ
ncbi:hypothetical protein ACTXT7_017126, partial [Hymenolepis weldensis]